MELPEVATAAQVAEYLQTTEASLAQDRYLRRGVPYTRFGRRIRYMREDVVNYLAAQTVRGGVA
ncbi:DNA-binding protein [Mycobacteroides abscessus]|uniref:DNA-binding protein n=1 Tax=Mycobacteroides abscessus TaxID=36809 RepID=A0ABD7HSC2_9MYCO|nr:DNA-binding protein [Mycobacteroides abscessus]RIQ98727.1 DNA-binding protein [Mycobacteroides abscessus]RIR48767.1 DNA-binding protein [Mycobacteroides abscessus]RIT40283.1 DNA-binding protein [Mycobacteroides abscessus]